MLVVLPPYSCVRSSAAIAGQLLDAIVNKIDGLCKEIESKGGGGRDGTIGELCSSLRSYCLLVTLGCPSLQATSRVQTALNAPLRALKAVLMAPLSARAEAKTSGAGRGKVNTGMMAGGALRLEELVMCVILVTAARVSGSEDAGMAAGRSGGERAREGIQACSLALRRLILFTTMASTNIRRVRSDKSGGGDDSDSSDVESDDDDEGGDDEKGDGAGEPHDDCCCAGLYAVLLLRGCRLRALSEALGSVLGCNPPLSGIEDMRESNVARRASE